MKTRRLSAILPVLLATACSRSAPQWAPARAELLAAKRPAAEKAREAMAKRLRSELLTAIGEGGPAAGVLVCSQRAPTIAANVAATHGVRIGRSSILLRNPDNAAPAWAKGAITARDTPPEARFFAGPDGQLGALFPIVLQPQCVICHGTKQQIPPAVQAALAVHYPFDKATGFAPGDLRGWFWVEVP